MAWNRYGYVKYNPLKYIDPSGHFEEYHPEETNRELLRRLMERVYEFSFNGFWTNSELGRIYEGVKEIKSYVEGLGKSGVNWIRTYLASNFSHGTFLNNDVSNYVLGGTIHLSKNFSKGNLIHEFGHVLDNKVGYMRKGKKIERAMSFGLPKWFFDSTILGGGPSDDLFTYMGGKPTGFRFYNGGGAKIYSNTKGVMRTLPDQAKFIDGHYGNYSSADYFAETFEATIMGRDNVPVGALNWMRNFIVNNLP